jgi:hypothetical protein
MVEPTTAIRAGTFVWKLAKPITRVKRKLNKRRARLGKPLLEINEETDMLRTSTGAGLGGILANVLIQIMQAVPFTAELAASPEFAGGLTALFMWALARIWKTPAKPGIV